jgi:hypothetical protein
MPIKQRTGDWKELRAKFGLTPEDEVDLHFGRRDPHTPYDNVMADVETLVERSLIEAQKAGRPYLMFIHGSSTSRPGKTSARSVVRQFMRSKAATPLIEWSGCIQHRTIFLAKIRLPKQPSKATKSEAAQVCNARQGGWGAGG